MALARAQMEQFREEGFVAGIPVFSGAECERFRETAERFRAEQPADRDWAFDIKCNLLFDWVYENATHPRLLDVVADLLGEDLLLTDSVFRIKEPGSGTHYGWHQDSARIVVEPAPAIVYVAISDATVENGCVAVIPRDPRPGPCLRPRCEPGTGAPPRGAPARGRPEPGRVHGAPRRRGRDLQRQRGPRLGPEPRAGRAVRDPPRLHAGVGTPVSRTGFGQLVRGRDVFGHFAHEPVPSADFEANVRMRRRILTEYPENILMGPLEPGARPDFPDRREASS